MKGGIQEAFLRAIREEGADVIVYLTRGNRLEGKLVYFDLFTVLIDDGRSQQLIYKHAISTIIPKKRITFSVEE